MRRGSLLWCALSAAVGCVTPRQMPPAGSAAAASDTVERGVLGLVADGDTTVIEGYTRTARVLEGVVRPHVRGAKFGWARYRVEFGPSGDAERAILDVGGVRTRGHRCAPGRRRSAAARSSKSRATGSLGAFPSLFP